MLSAPRAARIPFWWENARNADSLAWLPHVVLTGWPVRGEPVGRCRPVFALGLLLVSAIAARAQQPCGMPAVATTSREPKILTSEQAEILGDPPMQQIAGEPRLVSDPALNRYARR